MEYLRTTKIIKTGTSLCVVVPKNILKAINMQRGDQVCFVVVDGDVLVIRNITQAEILLSNNASAGATAMS